MVSCFIFRVLRNVELGENVENVRAVDDGVVLLPLQLRRVAQLQALAQRAAQEAARGLQPREHFLGAAAVEQRDVDLGIAQGRRRLHMGDGDHGLLDAGILQQAELLGQLALDLLIDASDAVGCHKNFLLPARRCAPRASGSRYSGPAANSPKPSACSAASAARLPRAQSALAMTNQGTPAQI